MVAAHQVDMAAHQVDIEEEPFLVPKLRLGMPSRVAEKRGQPGRVGKRLFVCTFLMRKPLHEKDFAHPT